MTKAEYRETFEILSYYLKMNKFLEIAEISKSNFSRFMKSEVYDDVVSVEKLKTLLKVISEVLNSWEIEK